MSDIETKSIARRFVQEIFNEGKLEDAKKFVTSDIIYHGVFEEVKGLENFKKWIAEDRDAFPDMKVTIIDDFGEQNNVAIRWTLKGTHEKEFSYLNSRWCLSFQLGRHPSSLIFLHTILQPFFSIVLVVNTYSRQSGVGHLVSWSLKPSPKLKILG